MAEKDDAPGKTGAARSGRGQGRDRKPAVTIDGEAGRPAASGPEANPEPVSEPEAEMAATFASPPETDHAARAGDGDAPGPASDVRRDEAAPPSPPPVPPTPPASVARPPSSPLRLVAAGVVGGVIATILGILYHASGIVPSRSETAATQAARTADGAAAAVASLDSRVAALEQRPEAPAAADMSALSGRVATLESSLSASQGRIAGLEARPAGAASGAVSDLAARVARLETEISAASGDPATVAGLSDRIAALESALGELSGRVETLTAEASTAADAEQAARAVAVGVVRQAAANGEPFADDLAMLTTLGVETPAVAELRPLADKGVPTVAALQAQFPAVADRMLAAGETGEGGFFESLAAYGRGLVTVRPTAPMEGDSPEAIVSRMQAAVDRGDLAAALAERDSLPDPARQASAEWAAAAADRVTLTRLLDELAAPASAG